MEFLDDFMMKVTRAQFEERCSDLFEKVITPIDKVLKRNNLTIADIDQFEAIGGAWRTPKIQELIQEYIGNLSISTHLNSHEAMATGSAFHAANGSFSFRARPILLSDGLNVPVSLTLQTLNETRKVEPKKVEPPKVDVEETESESKTEEETTDDATEEKTEDNTEESDENDSEG